jgi:hypothetical protein
VSEAMERLEGREVGAVLSQRQEQRAVGAIELPPQRLQVAGALFIVRVRVHEPPQLGGHGRIPVRLINELREA